MTAAGLEDNLRGLPSGGSGAAKPSQHLLQPFSIRRRFHSQVQGDVVGDICLTLHLSARARLVTPLVALLC
jgi:hypothetical protein